MLGRNAVRRASATTLALASAALGLTLPAATAHAAPAVNCAPGVWKAAFYPNTTFRGAPKKTACDSTIDENYGKGAPAGLPRDNFGVRWTTTRDFGSGGPFTFSAEAAGGIRVHLDNARKVDLWKNTKGAQKKSVRVTVPKGKHTLRVDYANFTGPARVKFAYTPLTGKADDKVRPLAPAGLKASFDKKSGKATLSWARNSELDLAGYQVHRRDLPRQGAPGAWKKISGAKLLTSPSFTDRPADNGNGYAYTVTAVDKAGNVSGRSADARITTPGKPVPADPAPYDLTASAEPKGVTLSWHDSGLPGNGYHVYRATGQSGPWTRLTAKPLSSPGYLDATAPYDRTVFYRVTRLNTAGKESRPTTTVPATRPSAPDTTAPAAPLGLKVTADGRKVKLSWDRNTEPDVRGYHVWRRADHTNNWQQAGTTWTADLTDYTDEPRFDGTAYDYAVTAFDTHQNESQRSASVPFVTKDLTPPDIPFDLAAYGDSQGIHVRWEVSRYSDNKAAAWKVYRADDNGEPFELVATVHGPELGYLDRDVPPGAGRVYTVTAVDEAGNESERIRPAVSATRPRQLPNDRPATPTGLTATSSPGSIRLSWNAVAGDGVTYRLYRYENGRINPVVGNPLDRPSYLDIKALDDTWYTYKVVAVDANGVESDLSEGVQAKRG